VRALPGVLDHGLFTLVLADVLVGHPDGSVTTAA
jgi:ribose 5-phosphate isomerase